MTLNKLSLCLSLALLPLLAGCGGSARQALGLDHNAPDAYNISTHAPLEMPATMATLPTPKLGMARPQEVTPQQQAAQIILGQKATPIATNVSAAEQALLQKVGTAEANIRSLTEKEAKADAAAQDSLIEPLIFWRKTPQAGVVVDAAAEAERLKQNRATGAPPTAGATAVIEETGRLNIKKAIQ